MIVREQVTIGYLKLKRKLDIYVPDNLKEDENVPVIYMFDGHNLFFDEEATYGKSWNLKEYFDQNKVKAMIVGIEGNKEGYQRLLEFSPYPWHMEDFKGESTGKEFLEWLVNDLKPYIDSKYPTLPDRKNTILAGSSMGGLMALYGVVFHNDVFSKACSISPHHIFCLKELLEDLDKAKVLKDTKLYLSYGSSEFKSKMDLATWTNHNMKIINSLAKKLAIYPHLYVGGKHDEASWEKETKVWLSELEIG